MERMSLSKYLQSPEILAGVQGKDLAAVRAYFIEKGMQWFACHPEETGVIANNLRCLDRAFSDDLIENIKEHIVLHYFEKVLPVCTTIEQHHTFLKENITVDDALSKLSGAISAGNGILLAIAHFGGVELIVPTLALCLQPVHVALRYTTEHFSQMAHEHAVKMTDSGLFGPIGLIEIGKPGTVTALAMAAVLRRQEILVTVFDEETEHSKPVQLFGRTVKGGSGLDKLLRFTNTPVVVFNAFMVRGENHTYHLNLIQTDPADADLIQTMYRNLESIVSENIAQWYFLHEEIPFVE